MKKKPKILIFEGEDFFRDVYIPEFTKRGFEVKAYKNYKNLIGTVLKEKPDIIFCGSLAEGDVGEVDGFEAIKILTNEETTKEIPIITVIDLGKEEDVRESLKLGAQQVYTKDKYTPQEVAEGTKEYLINTGKFKEKDFK